ncbi:MAG: lamin tail domain-containing protein [Planctomycetales bacterium]|nr:lamin tail domain-containing protein [Planctomycetales bacterium]
MKRPSSGLWLGNSINLNLPHAIWRKSAWGRASARSLKKRSSRRLQTESLEARVLLYAAPVGGWDYLYHGDSADNGAAFTALDGTWDHDNGSDQWDGSIPGEGAPGGAGAFDDGDVGYLRLQDTGNPSGQFPDPNNRKLFFAHDLASDVPGLGNVLSTGVTLTFRARLSTDGVLDGNWPAGGDGYQLHDNGKGNFVVSSGGSTISFVLALPSDGALRGTSGLVTNGLSAADTIQNQLDLADLSQWHEFWVTIEPGGTGTHVVTVYADDAVQETYNVRAGSGTDYSGTYIAMATGSTGQSGAIDIDFFGWKQGVVTPDAPDPPVVTNSAATNVGPSSATIGGSVVTTGGELPNVTIYWGDNDGGTDASGWDHSIDLGQQGGSYTATLSDLSSSTSYFYRSFAENSAGSDWADTTTSFTTTTVTAPSVFSTAASNIAGYSASLNGIVVNSGGEAPLVTIYYGTTNGGTNPAAWQNSVVLGNVTGAFSATVSDLQPNTSYFNRAFAQNSAGSAWSFLSQSFRTATVSPPVVSTLPPASVGPFSATLSGTIDDDGGAPTSVTFYWGETDGGTNPAAWDHQVDLGEQDGNFSTVIGGLQTDVTYYYRVFGQSPAGSDWADTSQSFTTYDAPPVLITELMASNRTALTTRTRSSAADEYLGLPTSPDWVELHNPGIDPIDLTGHYLTDSQNNLTKWQFPDGTTIPPGGFLVVFSSGLNIVDTELDETGRYHTNFTLDGGGEWLGLINASGELVHGYQPYPNQRSNVSYGIDGLGAEHYYQTPTPGTGNGLGVHFAADTKFSVDRGFFTAPFNTVITTSTPGATIIYTTDGSVPSMTNGTQVPAPDALTPPTATVSIATTTTLRAATFRNDLEPSDTDAQTYVFAADVLQQSAADVPASQNWGHAGPDWEVDPNIVNLAENDPNRLREDDLMAVPTVSLSMDWNDMFGSGGIYLAGEGIPRATSFEYFDPLTGESIQANGSVQIQGGSSTERWKSDKLSMRVKFTEEFGPTKINFPFFGDEGTDVFDSLNLDAHLNYVWHYNRGSAQRSAALYVADQLTSDIHNALAGEGSSPHGRFVHVYINGIYWGLHNMHERADASFAAAYYGGEKEEYHAINQGRSIDNGVNPDGTPTSANAAVQDLAAVELLASAAGNGGLAEFQAVEAQLDVDHFIDYLLTNYYLGNGDWATSGDPNKNWYASRKNTPDGRWRFHSWDAEKTLENFAVGGRNDVGLSPRNLHNLLRGNEEYLVRFADHIQSAMFNGGLLTEEGILPLFERRVNEIDRAIVAESARWGDNETGAGEPAQYKRSEWLANINSVLTNFFPGRTDRVLTQLRTAGLIPSVSAPAYEVNDADQHGGVIVAGDSLSILAAAATVRESTTLLTQGDPALAFVPTDNSLETGAGPFWYETTFAPAGWIAGTNGVGYENSPADYAALIGTNILAAWTPTQSSVYTRFNFTADAGFNPDDYDEMTLRMKFEDGFIAYLNGQEIARANAPVGTDWQTRATNQPSDAEAVQFVDFDVTSFKDLLVAGNNVLAIHGLNITNTSSDLFVLPELQVSTTSVVSAVPVYYTLDGSDPREAGGAARGTLYDGPLELSETTQVRARAFDGTTWSAVVDATFVVVPPDGGVVLSEINYHPHEPTADEAAAIEGIAADDFEFIEVLNTHPTQSFNLQGMKLADGVDFEFGNFSLAPGARAVVVEDTAAFQLRYGTGVTILGQWSGSLSNGGERITLLSGAGDELMSFEYSDGDLWAERADGVGATLELKADAPFAVLSKSYSWQGSSDFGGSPGTAGSQTPGIVINEVLANSDGVLQKDSIELYNPTDAAIDISGWYLSDGTGDLLKYAIPVGTILAPGGYWVVDEGAFNPTPENPDNRHFALSKNEDDVWLVISDGAGNVTQFVDDVHFRASEYGQTLGRTLDGTGLLAPQMRASLGCQNSEPAVGPLVISEVNYNPGEPSAAALAVYPLIVEDDLEFVEIHNPTSQVVNLSNWRLRGGVDYDFDAGTMLTSSGAIVILSFEPNSPANAERASAFRTHYGIDSSVVLVGGFSGQLSDSGELLRLERPGIPPTPESTDYPRLSEDFVAYDDRAPWETAADGNGSSLQRTATTFFGNYATSWHTETPSPGIVLPVTTVTGDFNGDEVVDALDIDRLFHAVHTESDLSIFDLDGNSNVDASDVDYLVSNVLGTQIGDFNLDGAVDGTDFNVWFTHKFTDCGVSWASGDASGDGVVDGSDFNLWLTHRFTSAGIGSANTSVGTPRAPLAQSQGAALAIDTILSSQELSSASSRGGLHTRHVERVNTRASLERIQVRTRRNEDTDARRRLRVDSGSTTEVHERLTDEVLGDWG